MLAGRLSSARHSQFVGRTAEKMLFESVLAQGQLLYIHGPGGVGKSTLLHEYAYRCQELHIPALYLDVRNLEPVPQSFITALERAMDTPYLDFLNALTTRYVLFIDTYETIAPLDDWIREHFLTLLPENVLVVLAGRLPPSLAWRSDHGWQTLIRTLLLRNFNPDESRGYLAQRQIPQDQHPVILNFTHGHPLALSLIADAFAQRQDFRFQPEETPDIVRTLLEKFVQKVPSPAHRAALEVCGLVRLTTESLLKAALGMEDPHELFDWLRGLSFIESGRGGLFPHDLAREALVTDLRWRNPDWYTELHRRVRAYYANHLDQTTNPQEQQRILFEYIYLHRASPVVRPFFDWKLGGTLVSDGLQNGDNLVEMVQKHEGVDSASLARLWLNHFPEMVTVIRGTDSSAAGFVLQLPLHQIDTTNLIQDPGALACWRYLQKYAPLRSGEQVTLFRFWMAADSYQAVSPIQSLIFVNVVRHYLTTPSLAFTFFPCADPDFWEQVFAYADLKRLPEADFEVGNQRYGVYGHDWRVVPPMAWLTLLGERETAAAPQMIPAPTPDALTVLSEEDFGEAVSQALRFYPRRELLRGSPLLYSRLVIEHTSPNADDSERITILKNLLKEAADTLQQSPKLAKFYRVIYHTYLQPAETQEQAAELLDLPFSTYRRHLKSGVQHITNFLWELEIGQ